MANPAPEDAITLNVAIEGDDPCEKYFSITVPLGARFREVANIIQDVYWKQEQISIYGLRLYKVNLPFEQAEHVQLVDNTFLRVHRCVASEWTSSSDIDGNLIHIIARHTFRRAATASMHGAVTPPSPKSESRELVKKFNSDRLKFVQHVREKKTSSSLIATPKNFRNQQNGPDYINIGRPAEKVGLPIVLYHPVFGRFLTRLQSTDSIKSEVYSQTRKHFLISQGLYPEETNNAQARDAITLPSFSLLLGDVLQKNKKKGVEADGVITGPGGSYLVIMEMKNEIGMGSSDPSIQAAQSYMKYWSDSAVEDWLNSCCCPSILIGVAGPWMCVLGAIFLDRPVVQPLTDFLWVGEDPARPMKLDHIVRVFDSINQARDELHNYYHTNNPPSPNKTSASPFPYLTHYLDLTGQVVHFAYRNLLCSENPEKKIYLAETTNVENPRPIVVKFVHNYNADAHRLLAQNRLAPELLYDGTMHPESQPGPNHTMIVMEFVQGTDLESLNSSYLPGSVFDDIKTAIDQLHACDFVFGDLREPNVIVLHDSTGKATGKAMLVDFDWCGKHREGRYPLRMNLGLDWHADVGPGAVMDKEHDNHMLDRLRSEPPFRHLANHCS